MRINGFWSRFLGVVVGLVLLGGSGPLLARNDISQGGRASFWYALDNITCINEDARCLLWVVMPPNWNGQEITLTGVHPDPVQVVAGPETELQIIEWLWEPEAWERLPETESRHQFFHFDFTFQPSKARYSGQVAASGGYDTGSEEYRRFTRSETWLQTDGRVRDQARLIVGDEESPLRRARLLYDLVADGCRKNLENYGTGVQSWLNMGKVYMHKGEFYKAEAAFQRAQQDISYDRRDRAPAGARSFVGGREGSFRPWRRCWPRRRCAARSGRSRRPARLPASRARP